MSGHNIIVIGFSAGGLEPLTTILGGLPSNFPAAIFVVRHIGGGRTKLPGRYFEPRRADSGI